MLTENDVIDAVISYLGDKGWCIENVSRTDQRGFDILARKGKASLAVEAKGGTSSKHWTRRFGEPFTKNQKRDHIAVALYESANVFSSGEHRAGIALPYDDDNRKLIGEIIPALNALKVGVFLVRDDKSVQELLAP